MPSCLLGKVRRWDLDVNKPTGRRGVAPVPGRDHGPATVRLLRSVPYRETLIACSEAWAQSKAIRCFLAEIERHARNGDDAAGKHLKDWIAWAVGIADDLDALTGGLAKLLRNHEKVADEAAAEPKPSYALGYHRS
jgi:hypothetical protein